MFFKRDECGSFLEVRRAASEAVSGTNDGTRGKDARSGEKLTRTNSVNLS